MKTLLFCLLLFNLTSLQATEVRWHNGSIVLQSRNVLAGSVSVDPFYHIIIYKGSDSAIKVYAAHQIESVHFYDSINNINRKYISLTTQTFTTTKHEIYEVVLSGSVGILRKQKVNGKQLSDANDFQYFLWQREALTGMENFRKEVYPQMLHAMGKVLVDYIDKAKLNPNQAAAIIQIVKFYNKQAASGDITLSNNFF